MESYAIPETGPYIMTFVRRFSFMRSFCSRMMNETKMSSTISSQPALRVRTNGSGERTLVVKAKGTSASSSE
jgi:hypothetical protein